MGHLDNAATKELDRVDFDPRLRELVRIRASQLNGCAYCIDMHTKDARAVGETEQRHLRAARLARDAVLHRPRARRAGLHRGGDAARRRPRPAEAYEAVAADFSADEIAALVSLIVAINAWNAIARQHPRLGARARTSREPLPDRHPLRGQVQARGPRHRIGGESPLKRAVVQRVVERGHDHRLVEHEPAVPDRARSSG